MPHSWLVSRANCRQAARTAQPPHTALASRMVSTAVPVVPTGKNNSGFVSRQLAWARQEISAPSTGRAPEFSPLLKTCPLNVVNHGRCRGPRSGAGKGSHAPTRTTAQTGTYPTAPTVLPTIAAVNGHPGDVSPPPLGGPHLYTPRPKPDAGSEQPDGTARPGPGRRWGMVGGGSGGSPPTALGCSAGGTIVTSVVGPSTLS
ncbi:MAG: hypothetical protein QOF30_148 [Acidimicrobiaceae bacterium]|nr:hypothetical protein [Acidimicrobiaceae bacterium]